MLSTLHLYDNAFICTLYNDDYAPVCLFMISGQDLVLLSSPDGKAERKRLGGGGSSSARVLASAPGTPLPGEQYTIVERERK
jgi:hypothetical protein